MLPHFIMDLILEKKEGKADWWTIFTSLAKAY
jgi:hypothetical protein